MFMTRWTLKRDKLVITKATIKLTDSPRGLGHVQNRPKGRKIFEDKTKVFQERDRRILPSYHSIAVYLTSYIGDIG